MAINMSFFSGNISRRVIRQVRRRGFSIGDKGHSLCSLGDPCILLNRLVNDPISRPFCMAIVVNNFISVYEGYSWSKYSVLALYTYSRLLIKQLWCYMRLKDLLLHLRLQKNSLHDYWFCL